MSVIIDVATSPASAKSPGSFLDMNDLALSPSDSLQGAISPLKPISLDDAVQSVQRLVNDDTDGPEDILLAQGLSQRLELSIQAAKEAMETLKTDNMDEADPDKAKRNLRVFGQLYSRLVRKEMRLYSDQMESIEAEGQDASVGYQHDEFRNALLHFIGVLSGWEGHAEDFPGLHDTLTEVHNQLAIEDVRNTLEVFDTFYNITRAYHLPISMQELDEMVKERVPIVVVIMKRLEVLEDLNGEFVGEAEGEAPVLDVPSPASVMKDETNKLIRDCNQVFLHLPDKEESKAIEVLLANFLEIEIESMRELIGLDEIWYKDYETLRESASQTGLPAAVADFIAKSDASEEAQAAAPTSASDAAKE